MRWFLSLFVLFMTSHSLAAPSWKEVEKLASEQKLQAALEATLQRLAEAKKQRNPEEWTRALVKATQLEIGLHGFETAIRNLDAQPWPEQSLAQVTLGLLRAHAIQQYADAYSYEIRKRERVESKGTVDLRQLTWDQLMVEVQKGYARAWAAREELGKRPLDKLEGLLALGSFPPEVRGTLRDAVSYLRAQTFVNSAYWRPEHSNETWRLDAAALVKGGSAKPVALEDPEVHPLLKFGAVLDDLEAWHQRNNRKAAALETRRVRAEALFGLFDDEAKKKLVYDDLAARLPTFRDVSWWSMGQWQLAMFDQQSGRLTKALALAKEGARAYPQSPGGQNCAALVSELTAPDYQLTSMAVDGLGERSVVLTHRNLKVLFFRAYRVDVAQRITRARSSILLDEVEVRELIANAKPVLGWKVELAPTPDLKHHRTHVTPPLEAKGLYVIAASAREDFAASNNRVTSVQMQFSDLVARTEVLPDGKVRISVHEGEQGTPVPGAEVLLYRINWQTAPKLVESQKTDKQGEVSLNIPGRDYAVHSFRVRKDGDELVDTRHFNAIHDNQEGPSHPQVFVYTDRTVYRPQQKVLWKVVAYEGGGRELKYSVQPKASMVVQLVDANGEEVAKQIVKSNAFGSAAGEFVIPPGRLLGNWTLQVSGRGGANIRVEEYKRPTFEASLQSPEQALRLNQSATLKGEARYYFGLPVTAGQVRWSVRRVPDYPWWWSYFGYARAGEQIVGTGSAALQEDGTFRFTFTPEANPEEAKKGVTYAYHVAADVTDEGGETRSATRVFRLGFVAVQANLSLPGSYVKAGETETVEVHRTDLDGTPRGGTASWKLFAIDAPPKIDLESLHRVDVQPTVPEGEPKVVTEGDQWTPRAESVPAAEAILAKWKDGKTLGSGNLTHDEKGVAKLTLPALAAGAYRIRYETRDPFGATFTTFRDVLVGGKQGGTIPLPLVLKVDHSSVRVGEKASILVATGLENATIVYELWRGSTRVSSQVFSGKTAQQLVLPIEEKDRGGLELMATLVSDHQVISQNERIFIPYDNTQLEVSFATFRDKLRPGQKETWRVQVKGPKGAKLESGAAELLAYMYDQSLDVFAPHTPPDVANLRPQRFTYRNHWSTYGGTWGQVLFEDDFAPYHPGAALTPTQFQAIASYGIGGMGSRRFRGGMKRMAKGEAFAQDEGMVAMSAPPSPAPGRSGAVAETRAGMAKEADLGGEPAPSGEGTELRTNFAETAFFQPQLLVGRDGTVSFEFTVPDSVTRWNVWVHALTKDLKGGSLKKTAETVKDLLVRPYVPRFLREGDRAVLEIAVNNASEKTLTGKLEFDIIDPETNKSVLAEFGVDPKSVSQRPFEVAAKRGTTLRYELKAPSVVKSVAFKATARSGEFSDGELRPLPILPSRMHLVQSRFVTLRNADTRTMRFDDLAKTDDPTRINEQLVVTVDAQLFATVLNSLPYLIEFPYECTEQTLNRFVSTGIVSSVFEKYPAVARLAKELSKRETQLESFAADDPNRKMLLEESPWLQESRGGEKSDRLIKVLDPAIARAQRQTSLAKLQKAQAANGGFPWFPGGQPSPYMTVYLLQGFARAAEHGVDVPQDMIDRAWGFVAAHYRNEWLKLMRQDKIGWELITFLNYVASSFPTERYSASAITAQERQEMLDFSFKHWKDHSPYLKGMLTLTLKRMNRPADAKLVFDSVMDSAKTTEELGTYWAREERSWLWYNDTTESHAFALRVLSELTPRDPRRDGLVQWLLLDKKLNHWKSTRATAEVIYSLVQYLEQEKALGIRENATVKVGGKTVTFVFEPDKFTGKGNQVVVDGEKLVPARDATVEVSKTSKGFAFASATWHFSTEKLPEEARGDFFHVERRYFLRKTEGREATLSPLKEGAQLQVGDEIEVQLSLKTKHQAEYVHLRDPRGAGFEPVNPVSTHKWNLGIVWYEEVRDSGANFFFEQLPVGEYPFKYRLRATMAGTFRVGPATVQSMYAPEFNAYSSGQVLTIGK